MGRRTTFLLAGLLTACAQGGLGHDAGGRDDGRDAATSSNDAGCADDDGDGTCNALDRCDGHDDSRDADGDGVPDGCDCDTSGSECAPEASCEDGLAGVVCRCPASYTGDGRTCTRAGCAAPSAPENGGVSVDGEGTGAVATYACDVGYHLVGASSRVCQADGTYDGATPTCVRIDCGAPPSTANGTVSAPDTGAGAVATYACDAGYVLMGESARTCQLDGTWGGTTPTCVPIDCGSLPGVPDGSVVLSGTTLGASATYGCNTGYTMVGSATRTCQADGAWSGAAPTCAPVSCGSLPNPANGFVTLGGTTFGSTAVYACSSGYSLVGSSTRTCEASGAWSGSAPTCAAACPVPPSPTNGSVSYSGRTEGSTATYSCAAGFLLTGASHNRCGPSGWVGATPMCRRAMSCACSGAFAEGDRVRAAVSSPSGASGIAAGHLGTAIAGSSTSSLPVLIEWDAWSSGHSGNCAVATCGVCTATGSSRWWTDCAAVATQRLTCACGGAFSAGDRVVALVSGPSGAAGVPAGRSGTVIAGSTGGLPVLIQWDAWTGGHTGNCSGVASCGVCTLSATSNRWWTSCDAVGRAP